MIEVIGLRGFGIRGRGGIAQFFTEGWFPEPPLRFFAPWLADWRRGDAERLKLQHANRGPVSGKPFLLIGFSDGGTVAHEWASIDSQCRGLIVHSGMWREPEQAPGCPVLLLSTIGDMTPTDDQTEVAYKWYLDRKVDVSLVLLGANTWHGHEFANGLDAMSDWVGMKLGMKLPCKKQEGEQCSASR